MINAIQQLLPKAPAPPPYPPTQDQITAATAAQAADAGSMTQIKHALIGYVFLFGAIRFVCKEFCVLKAVFKIL